MVLNIKPNSECRNGRIIPRNGNQVIPEAVIIRVLEEVALLHVEDPASDEDFEDPGQGVSFNNHKLSTTTTKKSYKICDDSLKLFSSRLMLKSIYKHVLPIFQTSSLAYLFKCQCGNNYLKKRITRDV